MKVERKLKRGLAEISHLFSPAGSIVKTAEAAVAVRRLQIAQPEDPEWATPTELNVSTSAASQIRCATLFSTDQNLEADKLIQLLRMIAAPFKNTYFLSPNPLSRHDHTRKTIAAHLQRKIVSFEPVAEHVQAGYLEYEKFKSVMEPSESLKAFDETHFPHEEKKSLFFFDPSFWAPEDSPVLGLLDHAIFISGVGPEELMNTYQGMSHVLTQNPNVQLSLLLSGAGVEHAWEYAYEQLSEIVSHFLGCDLGFLGWTTAQEAHLRPELLLEEAEGRAHHSLKLRFEMAMQPTIRE